MNEIASFAGELKAYSTPLTIIVCGLLTWWKILPSLIDAISNRQSKIEERMGQLLDSATERFQREIKAADERHAECIRGQEQQREQIVALEKRIEEQSATIDGQADLIKGLKRQFEAMQGATLRLGTVEPSPMIDAMMERLDKIPDKKRP